MQDVNNVIQGSESAFSADEYAQRIRRTRERLSRAGVDVMIVTGPEKHFLAHRSANTGLLHLPGAVAAGRRGSGVCDSPARIL